MKQKTKEFLSNLFFGLLVGCLALAGAAAYFGAWSGGDPDLAPTKKKPLAMPTAKPSPRPSATPTPRPKMTPGATPVVVAIPAKPQPKVFRQTQPTPWPTMELSAEEKRALAERAKRFRERRGIDPP